jgi:hypothetical protein
MPRANGSLTLTGALGSRTFTVTSGATSIPDRNAGDTVSLTFSHQTSGTPPQAPTSVTIELLNPSGGVIRTINPGVATTISTIFTIAFTISGIAAAAARAGTMEVNIRATSTGGIGPYDVSSDNRGTQTEGGNTISRSRYWDRATTTASIVIGKDPTLSTPETLLSFGDTVYWQVVTGHTLYGTQPVSLTWSSVTPAATLGTASGNIFNNTAQTSIASFDTIDNTFPAALRSTTASLLWGGFTLTGGSPGLVPSSTTVVQSPDVDARVSLTRHVQADDNVFAVSKNIASGQRLTSQLCFLNTRFTNSRGEGVNGVSVTRHLYDNGQLVATPTAGVQSVASTTLTTTTADSQDGWLPVGSGQMIAWDESLPGGTWKVRHTSATFGSLLTYAGTSGSTADVPYTLVAADPNLVCIVGGGPTEANDETHFHKGDDLVLGLTIFNVSTKKLLPPDAGSAFVALARFSQTTGMAEYLEADGSWSTITPGVTEIYEWPLTETFPGSGIWVIIVPGLFTDTFTFSDLFVTGTATYNGIPVSNYHVTEVVADLNAHDGYLFDGPGFVGFPTR